jgi:nucleoside-diphosphate-sugar epimerase
MPAPTIHASAILQSSRTPKVWRLTGGSRLQPVFLLQPDSDPHKELIEPAVHGTKNVLQSVARSKSTVKRVVLTSSVAGALWNASTWQAHRWHNVHGVALARSSGADGADALPFAAVHGDNNIQPPKNGSLYTTEDWNATSTPEDEPYFVSKVES